MLCPMYNKQTYIIAVTAIILALMLQQAITGAKTRDVTTNPDTYFLKAEDVADALQLLPAPPEPDSVAFQLDAAMYQQGMTLRNSPAGERAAEDAANTPEQNAMTFSKAFGLAISPDTTPAILALARRVMGDAGSLATRAAKKAYARPRPFVFYGTATCKPSAQGEVHPRHSYPSGHSASGWALALVLSEINPKRQNEILRRGLELGQGRVICGYHWQSDVDAGRIVAAAVVARLHANDTFVQELAAAKEEFARLQQKQR